jgi:hypothetical protein
MHAYYFEENFSGKSEKKQKPTIRGLSMDIS